MLAPCLYHYTDIAEDRISKYGIVVNSKVMTSIKFHEIQLLISEFIMSDMYQ